MLDLERLLQPIDEAAPSGPDLEYDADFQELERLSQGKAEQQFGDTIIPAEEPEWRDVAKRSEALLMRSKDVRSACLLVRAQSRLNQFAGLAAGLQLMHRLMDTFWDSIHPQLDAEDNDDPTMRLNALAVMADTDGLLRDAREVRLIQSRQHGELSLRQIEVAAGKAQAREGDTAYTMAQAEQMVSAVLLETPDLAAQVSAATTAARELGALLDGKVGSDRSPDLKPLIALLGNAEQLVTRVAASLRGEEAGAEGDSATGEAGGGGGGPAINASSATIRSRADVMLLLDKVSDYLERTEPTNPAALMVRRAKRMMQMNFLELVTEMAPDGLPQVQVVFGPQASDQTEE